MFEGDFLEAVVVKFVHWVIVLSGGWRKPGENALWVGADFLAHKLYGFLGSILLEVVPTGMDRHEGAMRRIEKYDAEAVSERQKHAEVFGWGKDAVATWH